MADRVYRFDNIKAILIFLVVFGHFLELVKDQMLLYLIIYSFHMPFFMFVSGYFAKFNPVNIMKKMIYPYAVFQILYTCFDIYVLNIGNLTLTFVKPIWLLWYMFVLIIFYMLIPFLDEVSHKKRWAVIIFAIVLSLISGFDSKLGYYFSSARIFTFLPFFVTGYYMSKGTLKLEITKRQYLITLVFAVLYVITIAAVLDSSIISKKMLYGSYSYEAAEYNPFIKLLIMLIAYVWIALGLMLVPEKKLLLSSIGRYTMPIFLLHGFMVKLTEKYLDGISLSLAAALILSAAAVIILGNKYVNNIFNMVFMRKYIEKQRGRR